MASWIDNQHSRLLDSCQEEYFHGPFSDANQAKPTSTGRFPLSSSSHFPGVEQASEPGTVVVVSTIFPVGEAPLERRPFWSAEIGLAVQEVNDDLYALADDNIIIFDTFALLADGNGLLRPEYARDELHLNAAGYAALNGRLTNLLSTLEPARRPAK